MSMRLQRKMEHILLQGDSVHVFVVSMWHAHLTSQAKKGTIISAYFALGN